MHIKIFDCEIIIDSHEISILNPYGGSSEKSFNKSLPIFLVKEIIENYLFPDKAFQKFKDSILKTE